MYTINLVLSPDFHQRLCCLKGRLYASAVTHNYNSSSRIVVRGHAECKKVSETNKETKPLTAFYIMCVFFLYLFFWLPVAEKKMP